ncbi:13001_t:CDS:1, partial [Entrophospora sp. SA101]
PSIYNGKGRMEVDLSPRRDKNINITKSVIIFIKTNNPSDQLSLKLDWKCSENYLTNYINSNVSSKNKVDDLLEEINELSVENNIEELKK